MGTRREFYRFVDRELRILCGNRWRKYYRSSVSGPIYQSFPMAGQKRAQVWAYAAQYRRPRHFHAEPELNLVVAGRAMFGVGDSTVQVGAGELLSFLPGQDHALLEASPD